MPAHNSVYLKIIGILRRPFYRGRHANDPVCGELLIFPESVIRHTQEGLGRQDGSFSLTHLDLVPNERIGVYHKPRKKAFAIARCLPDAAGERQRGGSATTKNLCTNFTPHPWPICLRLRKGGQDSPCDHGINGLIILCVAGTPSDYGDDGAGEKAAGTTTSSRPIPTASAC